MIWSNYLSVILPAAFSTIDALNLPTPLNQTVEFLSQLTSDWGCSYSTFTTAPHYKDCERAFRKLPQSGVRGKFHQTGKDDLYKLPVSRLYNTCRVTVSLLPEAQQDESLWVEIVFMSEVLNDLCVDGRNYGGYILTGQNESIKIELMSAWAENGTVGGQVDVT